MIPARMTMSLSSGPSPVGSNSKSRSAELHGDTRARHCRHKYAHTDMRTYVHSHASEVHK